MIVPLLMGVGLIYSGWIKKYPCIEATYIVGNILCYTEWVLKEGMQTKGS